MTSAPVAPPISSGGRPCPACNRDWGHGMVCQFCKQVEGLPSGVRLASAAKRFGGYLLEILLIVVTLFIGWLVWSLIIYSRGQTPSKHLLKMRVVKLESGTAAAWGTMFVREWIAK